ncbi:MAG: fibronectin type III domain-containing protein [Armatimonadetes bacterium]|nr:fibronectin type III domain-containing protein [Armatimonadota bacterium]
MVRHSGWVAIFPLFLLTLITEISWSDELCITNNIRRNQGFPVDFHVQPNDASKLFDGSLLDSNSFNMVKDGRIVIAFKEPMLVTRVVVLYYNDEPRTYNAARDATISLLDGSGKVVEQQKVLLDGDPQVRIGTDHHLVWAGRSQAKFSGKRPIMTVFLDIRKKPDAHQACLREVEIWGLPVSFLKEKTFKPIDAKVSVNTYSSLRLDWKNQPEGTVYIRTQLRQKGEQKWHSICFTKSPGIIMGLTPGAIYEVCVDAALTKAVNDKPNSKPFITKIRLPKPLEVQTVGDVFGMNFFPGGGGARQPREDETRMTMRMCQLMKEAGVKHVRWWLNSPGGAELFTEYGISLLPYASASVEDFRRMTEEGGVWVYSVGGEPDFNNIFAEDYVSDLKKVRLVANRVSKKIYLIGPCIGGELEGPGSDYLDACYLAGMKGLLDAIAIHPYCKLVTPTPLGGQLGGPEGVLNSLKRALQVMERNGEGKIPIVVTEMGYPTHEGWWHVPAVNFDRQAEWIVRAHLLMIAKGVRRIWWYAFQDEGTDRKNPEHNFGIVDWYGQPKPAYFAYKAMVKLLADTTCDGLLKNLKPPVYAVQFRKGRKFLTAIWDSGGESEIVLIDSVILDAFDLFGDPITVPKGKAGKLKLTVTEKVTYLLSSRPLRIISQNRLKPPIEPQVQMSLKPTTIVFLPGETKTWTCTLVSEFDVPVQVRLSMSAPWGEEIKPIELTLKPKEKESILMSLTAPLNATKQIKSWDIQCEYRPLGTSQEWRTFRRAIFFQVRVKEEKAK